MKRVLSAPLEQWVRQRVNQRAFPYILGAWLGVPASYAIFDAKPIGAIGFAGIVTLIPYMKHYWSQV